MRISTISQFNNKLIDEFISNNIIVFNKNKYQDILKGLVTSIIFRLNRCILFPDVHDMLCKLYCKELTKPFIQIIDYVVPASNDILPLVTLISSKLKIPVLLISTQTHSHKFISKPDTNVLDKSVKLGSNVIIIDSVITNGTEFIETVAKLRDLKLNPIEAICLAKSSRVALGVMHGAEIIRGIVPLKSLICMKDIEIKTKLSNRVCAPIHARSMDELSNIISYLYKYVSIIKINIDFIHDFDPEESPKQLQCIKNKYGILLWEDRKFTDTSQIIHKQIMNNVHKISQWADIISVHPIVGPELKKISSRSINGCKIIISGWSQYYSESKFLDSCLNIIDPLRYNVLNIESTKSPTTNSIDHISDTIIGIVTSRNITTNLLKIVPNVKTDNDCFIDDQIVHYNTLSDVSWADILIVNNHTIDYIINQYIVSNKSCYEIIKKYL